MPAEHPTQDPSPKPLQVLRLTLKKPWFDMIASGEKTEEYRKPSDWILSRLIGKQYDVVEFSNGYGHRAPKILVKFFGWHQGPGRPEWGAIPHMRYVVIRLGQVISRDATTDSEVFATTLRDISGMIITIEKGTRVRVSHQQEEDGRCTINLTDKDNPTRIWNCITSVPMSALQLDPQNAETEARHG